VSEDGRETPPMTPPDLEEVARLLPDAVVVVDGAGVLVWANESAERLLGVAVAEWVGASTLGFVHPEDAALVAASFASIRSKQVGTPIEIRVRAADGWRLVEVVGANLLEHEPIGAIVLCLRDLTERRRWEVAHEEVSRFRALVHNAAAIMLLLDADGRVQSVSAAMTRLLGHDQEVVEGRLLSDFVAVNDRGRLDAVLRRPADPAVGPATLEVHLVHSDEERPAVPVELSVVNLLDDPTVRGLVVSGHDISELRHSLEELAHIQRQLVRRERLAAVGQLASMIGHELRNPLTAVANAHYLMRQRLGDEIDEVVARQLAMAERESSRAVQLTENLMSYVRPRKPDPATLELVEVVGQVVESTAPPAGVQLELDLEPVSMTTDRSQLIEMLSNLLLNAYQALEPDGGAVRIASRTDGDDVELCVEDDGPGIEAGAEDRLFEPFFSTKAAGTGLGLAIVARLTEEQGGSVALERRPEGGTLARLRLPRTVIAPMP
jgi:PAS domain S-box-containing protein